MQPLSFAAVMLTLGVAVVSASTRAVSAVSAASPTPAPSHEASGIAAANDTIATYCVPCHNDRRKSGTISLSQFDVSAATKDLDVAERVIRRLRAGMMPPAGAKRPEGDTLTELAATIEQSVDTAAAAAPPDPGRRPFQRLNRAEYAQAIRDLVGVAIDPAALLPPDTISGGFDNVADVQTFSPTLVTSYLQAARQISEQAVASDTNRLVYACRPRSVAGEAACARAYRQQPRDARLPWQRD